MLIQNLFRIAARREAVLKALRDWGRARMDSSAGNLAFGDYVIDRADERLIGPSGPIRLGNKAWRVLLALIEQDGRLLTKDALFETVWDGTIVTESSLTSAIKELRRALGDESRTPRFIESVYGRGYRFIAPVKPASEAPAPPSIVPAAPPPARAGTRESRPPLIVVSEFRDEAVRATHPWYAAQLREEILSGLSRFREVQLVDDDRPEAEAARDRAVERGYQLVATLLPDGEGLRLIARTRRLGDGLVLWAETLSLADTGAAGSVEKIVRRIAGAVLPAVDEDVLAGLPRESDDLYDRYLLAKRRSWTAADFAEAKQAAAALEAIVAERPGFGLAYAPLVRLYNTDFGYTAFGSSGTAERDRALELAKTGLAADRTNVHARTVLGFCHLWHHQADQARACFEQALAQNPYNPVRLSECATGLMFLGAFEEARELIYRAVELNPVPDDWFHEDLGRLLLFEGDFEGGLRALSSIARCSIWAELYRALCELGLDLESGPAHLAAWRRRVEAGWHAASAPTDAEVAAWIRNHNPLPPAEADRVFAPATA